MGLITGVYNESREPGRRFREIAQPGLFGAGALALGAFMASTGLPLLMLAGAVPLLGGVFVLGLTGVATVGYVSGRVENARRKIEAFKYSEGMECLLPKFAARETQGNFNAKACPSPETVVSAPSTVLHNKL